MISAVVESLIGGMPEARLEFHLDNWRRFMRSDVVGENYPERSSGFIPGGYSETFEEMLDRLDLRCARIVDALMLGLSLQERCAMHHNYLRAVFRFPRHSLPELLGAARFKIARGLVARGIY